VTAIPSMPSICFRKKAAPRERLHCGERITDVGKQTCLPEIQPGHPAAPG